MPAALMGRTMSRSMMRDAVAAVAARPAPGFAASDEPSRQRPDCQRPPVSGPHAQPVASAEPDAAACFIAFAGPRAVEPSPALPAAVHAQQLQRAFRHFLHRPQPADPLVAAREQAFLRPDELRAARFERGHILLRGRVQPHLPVHGRRDQDSGLRVQRQRDAAQGVVGQAQRQLGDGVGRRRARSAAGPPRPPA